MLYVEGPRDREILESWARRVEPAVARCIEESTVILGGRQPARAQRDFQRRGGHAAGWRGLIVLDRDHHEAPDERAADATAGADEQAGLETFVWGLRHIESYLLVPTAIRRLLGVAPGDDRVETALADPVVTRAAGATTGGGDLHAKRILGAGGSLSEALGRELRAGAIARAMRADELHADVHALIGRIGDLSGAVEKGPEVVVRSARREGPGEAR